MFQWIFLPFEPFVLHPERIALAAAVFCGGYAAVRLAGRFRAWPLLVAACVWASWVPWEWHASAMKWDIRVDLLVLCPLLLIITCWALLSTFWLKSWK